MNNYGLPGLALLGPILISTHIAAFIGMTLGATKKNPTLRLFHERVIKLCYTEFILK
jgi:hypothetical protein